MRTWLTILYHLTYSRLKGEPLSKHEWAGAIIIVILVCSVGQGKLTLLMLGSIALIAWWLGKGRVNEKEEERSDKR